MCRVCNIATRASVLLFFISVRTCGLIEHRLVLEESNSHRTVPFNGDLLMQGGCLPLPTAFVLHDFLSFSFFIHCCSCFLANVKSFLLDARVKHTEFHWKKGEKISRLTLNVAQTYCFYWQHPKGTCVLTGIFYFYLMNIKLKSVVLVNLCGCPGVKNERTLGEKRQRYRNRYKI